MSQEIKVFTSQDDWKVLSNLKGFKNNLKVLMLVITITEEFGK